VTFPEVKYTLDPRAPRQYLGRHLTAKPMGHFDFLALPTEIRTIIYEYALSFPRLHVSFSDGTA